MLIKKSNLRKKLRAKNKVRVTKARNEPVKKPRSKLYKAFAVSLAPKPSLDIDRWSDEKRMLPERSAHEAGLWRTSRFPFLRRIMQLLSPSHPCHQVSVMKGAQLGFTEVALNWMFYTVDHSPASMLYVQKTLVDMEVFVKQRFDPSIDAMDGITLGDGRGKGGGDTAKIKLFPGGMIRLGGANSATSLRSMPIERLMLDEEESYEADLQDEGSPSALAIRRTANYPNRKIFRLSTPKIKETSVIEPLFEAGTKERYYLPCPHCGNMDYIRWGNIKYENDDPKTASLLCESCGVLIEEHHKTFMLEHGEWRAENPDAEHYSFHISSLYSPYGFYSWKQAVEEWLEAIRKNDTTLLKTFTNTVLGETWSESGRTIKASILEKRKEVYSSEVPEGALVLTAGADVQKDRIECEVIGWGKGMESWGVEYAVFRGNTEQAPIWNQFESFLLKGFKYSNGAILPIAITCVDSGFLTKIVYAFCKRLEHRNVYPIKGDGGWGRGYIDRPMKKNKYGVWAFRAFVDEIKIKIYANLQVSDPGPGYCHWADRTCFDKVYYKQLTSEYLDKEWVNGRYTLKWKLPKGRRNESLDTRVYNIAALNILNPQIDTIEVSSPQVPIHTSRSSRRTRRRQHSQGVV